MEPTRSAGRLPQEGGEFRALVPFFAEVSAVLQRAAAATEAEKPPNGSSPDDTHNSRA